MLANGWAHKFNTMWEISQLSGISLVTDIQSLLLFVQINSCNLFLTRRLFIFISISRLLLFCLIMLLSDPNVSCANSFYFCATFLFGFVFNRTFTYGHIRNAYLIYQLRLRSNSRLTNNAQCKWLCEFLFYLLYNIKPHTHTKLKKIDVYNTAAGYLSWVTHK